MMERGDLSVDDEDEYPLHTELTRILEGVTPSLSAKDAKYFWETLGNHDGLLISNLLYDDTLGDNPLPDELVARLWELGFAMGYDADFLVEDDTLAKARPERRVRPTLPRLPLAGGGHGPGRAIPGKREFPQRWDDDTTMQHTMDVSMQPSGAVPLPHGGFRAWGERDGVLLAVLVSSEGELLTSYPVSGEGVQQNDVDGQATPPLDVLQGLLDRIVADSADEPRRSLDELMAVGEWPHVILALEALGADERTVADLRPLAGL